MLLTLEEFRAGRPTEGSRVVVVAETLYRNVNGRSTGASALTSNSLLIVDRGTEYRAVLLSFLIGWSPLFSVLL